MSKRAIPVLAIALAAFAAGCGSSSSDSSSSSSSTTTALSKEAYLKQADAICTQGNKDVNTAAHKVFTSNKQPTKSQFEQFATDTLIPSVQGQIDAVRALPAPAGDEATVTKALDDSQAALDKAKQDPTLLESNGPGVFAQANKELKAYGFKVCGQ